METKQQQQLESRNTYIPTNLQVCSSMVVSLNRCKDCNEILILGVNWYSCNSRGKRGSIYLCKKCISKRRKLWSINNKEKEKETHKKTEKRLRMEVINHYGGVCVCCGEKNYEYLTIDHIYGDGNKHKKTIENKKIYRWLKHNNFPKGYQILCFNCNLGKNRGVICPHNRKEFEFSKINSLKENSNSNNVRKSLLKLKIEIIKGYGNVCVNCGENNPYFLTIDHKNNDGHIERKKYNHQSLYRKLKRENYPKENYQLLCFNCNCSKESQRKIQRVKGVFNYGKWVRLENGEEQEVSGMMNLGKTVLLVSKKTSNVKNIEKHYIVNSLYISKFKNGGENSFEE